MVIGAEPVGDFPITRRTAPISPLSMRSFTFLKVAFVRMLNMAAKIFVLSVWAAMSLSQSALWTEMGFSTGFMQAGGQVQLRPWARSGGW